MADICPPGKSSWPELVGIKATIAKHIIKKDNSNVERVESILAGSMVTQDFSCERVRMFVNIEEAIVKVPSIG